MFDNLTRAAACGQAPRNETALMAIAVKIQGNALAQIVLRRRLEMDVQMRLGAPPGVPDPGDRLTCRNRVPRADSD